MKINRLRRIDRLGPVLLILASALCVLAIGFLVQEVRSDLQRLNSANSDNVQWSLSQAEVEFLEFQKALQRSVATGGNDLDRLRLEFDIFYSRIVTLQTGSTYVPLLQNDDFRSSLQDIRVFLDTGAALIDTPDSVLAAELGTLAQEADAIRPRIRDLATSGLGFFATQSDARRTSIAVTLFRLALVTMVVVGALALLSGFSHLVSKQARQKSTELEDANARLNTILDTSLDGVVVSDNRGVILNFNAAAERIFGFSATEAKGRNLGDLIVPVHMRQAHVDGMERMRTTGERHIVGHGRVQLDAQHKSGRVFPIELAVESATAGEDEIFVGFLRDISSRVAAEQELVETRDRALASERAKAEFLAVMTHEIRTPLNGILGNLSLLQDTKLSPDQTRYANNMAISGRLLQHHVDTVLDIARFEAGKAEFAEEATDLDHLLRDIIDSQTVHAEANGNRLEMSWAGQPLHWVLTDPARLQQMLLNLIGNAIKFTQNGRITLEAESTRSAGNAEVEFRIIDTGIGIPEEDLPHVFDDFRTSDVSFDRTTNGTGLGLGIARRLAQGMGGEIGAESTLGEGSVFWIRLPFTEATAPERRQTDVTTPKTAPLKVLLVEDNEINRQVAVETLSRLGQSVTLATNGQEAVEAARTTCFDLILMDISMPVMDGLEATGRIRADGASSKTPIIALSANVLPESKDRFLAAGMSGFLGKPLRRDELHRILDRAARGWTGPDAMESTGMQELAELDPEFLNSLRKRFLTETRDEIGWMTSNADDLEQVAFRCHKLAGSAAIFDATDLRDALLQVESAAKAGNHDEVGKHLSNVQAVWNQVKATFAAR